MAEYSSAQPIVFSELPKATAFPSASSNNRFMPALSTFHRPSRLARMLALLLWACCAFPGLQAHGQDPDTVAGTSTYWVMGQFLDADDGGPIEGVEVTIADRYGAWRQITLTGPDGRFLFKVNEQSVFMLSGRKAFYFNSRQINISTIGRADQDRIPIELSVKRMETNVYYRMKVLFEINDHRLFSEMTGDLDYVKVLMQEHPNIVVEIGVHTDSRGDDQYNLELSQRRAEAIAEYLEYHGIAPGRIVPVGFGETRLVNRCGNGVRCSSNMHEQNRRVEFRIIRFE
jgi:outer membrane protein OmpA-like peptidoglycan-associated protein